VTEQTPQEHAADMLWRGLNQCIAMNRETTIATVTHWLEYHGAGSPDVPLIKERVRDDAQNWASYATQPELESYMVAALLELEKSGLTNKAAKRLGAAAFNGMDLPSRDAFAKWVGKQNG
jgi:hypothetical protein